jgi:hypothetical protein
MGNTILKILIRGFSPAEDKKIVKEEHRKVKKCDNEYIKDGLWCDCVE